ncbi:MAG: single-stranded DNA-binding protein [Pseudomonadota bacterium]
MAGLNKVMIIGNLGRDPEIRYSQQGLAVVKLAVATSDEWTDKNSGQKQEKTEWHRVVVFGKQGENCEKFLSKGSKVYVEGRLQTSSYEKEGQTHYSTDIIAANVMFLSGKGDAGGAQGGGGYVPDPGPQSGGYQGGPGSGSQGYGGPKGSPPPEDDIPF